MNNKTESTPAPDEKDTVLTKTPPFLIEASEVLRSVSTLRGILDRKYSLQKLCTNFTDSLD